MLRLSLFLLAAFSLSATAETITLKFATLAPEQSLWAKTFKKAAADVNKRTEGRVKLKLYAGGVHGDEQTVTRKIRVGQLHGAGFMGSGMSQVIPNLEAIHTPMLFRDTAEVDAVMKEMTPIYKKQAIENDYHILGWVHLGFSYIFSQNPVDSLGTLRTSKPWLVPNDEVTKNLFQKAGVSGISTPVSDVMTGLQSGLLETVAGPPAAIVSLQWFTRVNHYTNLPLVYSVGGLVLHNKAWKKLSEKDQKIVSIVVSRYFQAMVPLVRKQNNAALEAMKKRGITPTTVPDDKRKEFLDVCDAVRSELTGKRYNADARQQVDAALKQFRDKK
jgi:TRAP-type C4-dicarboxylate transport system substrate-binding protein